MHPNLLTCLQCRNPVRATARFCGQCGAALGWVSAQRDQAELAAPAAYERYRLDRLLGKGGFGEAYLAHDIRLDRPCVVKQLALAHAVGDQRLVSAGLEREARLLVALNSPGHPHIPEIYEYLPERQALVMKYIAGRNLAQLLDRRSDPFPEQEALRYTRDVCSALVYMHSRTPEPVLHRDIKPANILLGDDGRIWLIDFGLAKAVASLPLVYDLQTTQLAGTLGYSPPEQWRGSAEPRSDVYALAATLYMLLTNYQPSQAQLLAQMHGDPQTLPALRQLNPSIRPQVEQLVERGMAPDPAQRPSAQELLAELEALLSRPNIPPPAEPTPPPEVVALLGRDAELNQYRRQLEQHRLAIITGPPGVGKTALAATLARRFTDPIRVFWHAFHQNEGVDSLIWDLAAFLAWHEQDDLWQLLQSARLTGGQPPPPEALFDYLITLLHPHDYLLCLDDFQFVADDPLLDFFIRRLLPDVRSGAISVLMTSRTMPEFAQATITPLAGLSTDAARALLQSRGLALASDLVQTLTTLTGGNAQLLFLSINALQHANDPARVIANLTDVADIERYLLREVDAGLRNDERALMETLAALLGYPAAAAAIDAVLGARSSVRRILSSLTARNLIIAMENERGRAYLQHSIVQTFYYETLSKRRRTLIHHRAALYYAQEPTTALQAARHSQLAGEWTRAADLATADIWAIINAGQARALHTTLAQFAAARLDDARWVAVLLARGDVAALLGDPGRARQSYQDALAHINALPDEPAMREQFARACYGMGALLEYEAPQQALAWLARGLALIADISDRLAAALAIKTATVQIPLGNYAAAQAALARAEALLPEGPSQLRVSALHTLGTLYSTQGAIARGMDYTRQGLEICAQLNDTVRMAKILSNLAIDKLISADMPGALADFQRARELAERIGSESLILVIELNVGIAYARMGDDQAALQHIRDGVARARSAGARVFEITGRASLSDIYIRQGALDQAAIELDEAERLALESDARAQLPEIYRNRACLLLKSGDAKQAHIYIEQSLNLARAMQLDMDEGMGLRVLGQVLLADNQRPQAKEAFERSLALLDGNDPYEAALTRVVWEQALLESDPERSTS